MYTLPDYYTRYETDIAFLTTIIYTLLPLSYHSHFSNWKKKGEENQHHTDNRIALDK